LFDFCLIVCCCLVVVVVDAAAVIVWLLFGCWLIVCCLVVVWLLFGCCLIVVVVGCLIVGCLIVVIGFLQITADMVSHLIALILDCVSHLDKSDEAVRTHPFFLRFTHPPTLHVRVLGPLTHTIVMRRQRG
jgi:hypothetical protein